MATAKKASAKQTSAASKSVPQTARGRAQDRALISATQKYEVTYEAKRGGHSAAAVKAAIEEFGHSRVKVRKALEAEPAPAKKVAKKPAKRAG